ncbi:MAG: hypothetical protein CMN78_01075 [Spirochaetales bacterium]|nr:hypothetical protein [Spirochaetales bacterium]
MRGRFFFLICVGLLLFNIATRPFSTNAQQKRPVKPATEVFDQVMADLGPEGSTLAVVPVPPGWGDGRVTERDVLALAQYCVWGFNQLLAVEGTGIQIGPLGQARMIDFWVYVWDEVDHETKAVVSVADIIWATINRAWNEANPMQQLAIIMQFAGIVEEVWGGFQQETVAYLSGYITPEQYAWVVDQVIAAEYAAGGGGSSVGGALDVIVDYAQAEESYVINDGSGDIVYPD